MIELKDAFIKLDEYKKIGKKIGEGAFGKVFTIEKESDENVYAIKIVKTNFNGLDIINFIREALAIKSLKHPCIVKFYGIDLQFEGETKFQASIITEYLPRGSLGSILEAERQNKADPAWTPTKKYINLIGIAHAMRYMHNQNFLHRDLKPYNILVDDNLFPKICDFGCARFFPKLFEETIKNRTIEIGTQEYMSPEIFEGVTPYNETVDVYAFSMTAYEIITGKRPYYDFKPPTDYLFFKNVKEGRRPILTDDITEKMKNLLSKCWDPDIHKRPSFDVIFDELSHDTSYIADEVNVDEINAFIDSISNEETEKTKNKGDNKVENKSKEAYASIIKTLTQKVDNIGEIQFNFNYDKSSILHVACASGDFDLVKYLISLNVIDLKSKSIFPFNFE